jgi:hypothetical protein
MPSVTWTQNRHPVDVNPPTRVRSRLRGDRHDFLQARFWPTSGLPTNHALTWLVIRGAQVKVVGAGITQAMLNCLAGAGPSGDVSTGAGFKSSNPNSTGRVDT